MRLACAFMLAWVAYVGTSAAQDLNRLEGHGGPVMGLATTSDDTTALSASFDNAVGYWSLESGEVRWLDGHEAAVKTVIYLGNGKAASGGDDFAIHLWDLGSGDTQRLTGHKGKIMSLSAQGNRIASASWDGTIGLWDAETGDNLAMLSGHNANVNDVVFTADGGLISASYDGTIRQWDSKGEQVGILARHGFGVNTLVLNEAEGWLAYGAVDGGTRAIDLEGRELADLTLERRPVLAMATTQAQDKIAVGDGHGYVMVVETENWTIIRDFKAAKNGPVWALAFATDGETLLAGGIDDAISLFRISDATPGDQMATEKRDFHKRPETMSNGERQFQRKCSVCHSLNADDRRMAGPSLAGIFGRPAGKLENYSFSDAMAQSDLVWNAETIDLLFDLGPDNYVPGSKMPMQRMTSAQDRRDLIEFLRENTQ